MATVSINTTSQYKSKCNFVFAQESVSPLTWAWQVTVNSNTLRSSCLDSCSNHDQIVHLVPHARCGRRVSRWMVSYMKQWVTKLVFDEWVVLISNSPSFKIQLRRWFTGLRGRYSDGVLMLTVATGQCHYYNWERFTQTFSCSFTLWQKTGDHCSCWLRVCQ